MRRRIAIVYLLTLLAASFTAVQPLRAQQPVRPVPGGVLLNFQDADLAFVLSALAQGAGISFAYSDLPQKPVTLRTTEPLTPDQMLGLMRSLANANGISITEQDGVLRLQGSTQFQGLPEDPRQLYIYKLSHARAPVLAATLQTLFGGSFSPVRGMQQAQTLSAQLRSLNVQGQQPQQIVVSGGGGNQLTPFAAVVVPDEVTNSLLIRASPVDWQVMQQAIQALDLRPLQVVIEVIIAEVRRRDDLNVGVGINADASSGDRTTVGDLPSDPSDQDFTLRIVRSGDIDIEATLSALSSTGDVRILSRPVIHAQNNQQASISVGTERPFVQVSRGGGGVPGTIPEDIIQYRDVATTLNIVPTINEEGYVNMAIVQTINNATTETQFGAPVISKREAVTQILARTGQTVVVGGLIDRQTDRVRSGIPFLKDIPVLGYLFGNTRENVANSELFLFLTPHIVVSDEDAQRLKDALEDNVDLLQPLVPIRPLIPPQNPDLPPDTTRGAVPLLRPDTTRGAVPLLPPDTIPGVIRMVPPDTTAWM
jgi:type II secretory pathway component GspD/PulD (secretin)